ncbi:MAG: hypothetical protein N2C14_15250, partial [Planctomycetales bacterium]
QPNAAAGQEADQPVGRWRAILGALADQQPAGLLRQRLASGAAFAVAVQSMASPDNLPAPNAIKEGSRLARDAEAALTKAMAENRYQGLDRLLAREALVNARLALGQLLLLELPEYRKEPFLAFASAFDEAAKLPSGRGEVKVLGTPLLKVLVGRRGGSDEREVEGERQLRESTTRLAEGALSLHLGNPSGAVRQLGQALQFGSATGGSPQAADQLRQTLTLDDARTVRELLVGLKGLAEIQQKRPRAALATVLRTMVGGENREASARISEDQVLAFITEKETGTLVAEAVAGSQSPLLSYCGAAAVEAAAVQFEFGSEDDVRATLLDLARRAIQRSVALMKSERTADRFGHLSALIEQARTRLNSPVAFIAEAETLVGRGETRAAVERLDDGARRHPGNQTLVRKLFQLQIDVLDDDDQQGLQNMLDKVIKAAQDDLLNSATRYFLEARLQDRLGRQDEALAAYQQALTGQSDPRVRIELLSRIAPLKAQAAKRAEFNNQ